MSMLDDTPKNILFGAIGPHQEVLSRPDAFASQIPIYEKASSCLHYGVWEESNLPWKCIQQLHYSSSSFRESTFCCIR